MTPVSECSQLLKSLSQTGSHVDNSVSHGLDTVSPFFVESGILQNSVNNSTSVCWWVGVHSTDDQGHLRPTIEDELFTAHILHIRDMDAKLEIVR